MYLLAAIIESIAGSKHPLRTLGMILLGTLLYVYVGICTYNVTWPGHYKAMKDHKTNSSMYDRIVHREWHIDMVSKSDATVCAGINGAAWPLYWSWRGLEWAASWSIPKENP